MLSPKYDHLGTMNRTDRLFAIVDELRLASAAGRTSGDLAARFEVTARTIKRDISALQQSGMPIWSDGGHGGGYRILASATALPPLTFTAGEAAAIAVALHLSSDMPFATEGLSAFTKLLTAMGGDAATLVDHVLARVWTNDTPVRTRAARTLDQAILEHRVVRIRYHASNDAVTDRLIDPLRFALTGGNWYLMAYCHTRHDGRWFRLDRIEGAWITRTTSPDHDLEQLFGAPPPTAHPLAIGR